MRHCVIILLVISVSGTAFAQHSVSGPIGGSHHGDALDAISSLIANPVMDTEHLIRMLEDAAFKEAGYDPYTDSWLWGHQKFGMTQAPEIQRVIDSIEEDTEILGQVWFWKLGFRGVSVSLSEDESMAGLSAIAVSTTYFPDIFHACREAGFRVDTTLTRKTGDYGIGSGRQTEVKFLMSRETDNDEVWIWICRDYCLLKYRLSI